MIVSVTVHPSMTINARVIAAALAVLPVGERVGIAGQEISRPTANSFRINGRDAGPRPLAARCLETLTARQAAADALLADALQEAALRIAFAARRRALPAGDVPENAALADPCLRTLTPALLAAALDDPACTVVGVPCLVEIAATMIHARIIGAEARPDPRLVDKYGHELYPGVLMIRESNGADVWHKTSRRSVMIATSLAAAYDAAKPARPASKAADGLARLNAQAARAAADLADAQQRAQEAATALLQASLHSPRDGRLTPAEQIRRLM